MPVTCTEQEFLQMLKKLGKHATFSRKISLFHVPSLIRKGPRLAINNQSGFETKNTTLWISPKISSCFFMTRGYFVHITSISLEKGLFQKLVTHFDGVAQMLQNARLVTLVIFHPS